MTTKRLRKLPATTAFIVSVEDRKAQMIADRMIAWDANQTPAIREAARLRSLRFDDFMAEEGQPSVLTEADETAKANLIAAGIELALVAGNL